VNRSSRREGKIAQERGPFFRLRSMTESKWK
jgi:hypothetical protein